MKTPLTRTYFLTAVFVLAGAVFAFLPAPAVEAKTEKQLIELMPNKVGKFNFLVNPNEEGVSYRMDEETYKILKPFGIVARKYSDGNHQFDAVVIASDSKDSFHNPLVCFSAQQWTIESQTVKKIQTEHRGEIPITLLQMSNPAREKSISAYVYRGPFGFEATSRALKLDMVKLAVTQQRASYGVFYRFMADDPNTSEQDLVKFISEFIDSAKESSNDYF